MWQEMRDKIIQVIQRRATLAMLKIRRGGQGKKECKNTTEVLAPTEAKALIPRNLPTIAASIKE